VDREAFVSFIAQFAEIHAEVRRRGIAAYDMRDEGNLELVYVGTSGLDVDGATGRASVKLGWLESEPGRTRPVPTLTAPSPIRYFLDGSQRTLRAFYCDNVPVITGIVGAAVLERNDRGEPKVMPGMLAFKHVWVIPTVSDLPGLNQLVQVISSRGGTIVDPLDELPPDRYQAELHEFGGVIERGFKRVGKVRQDLEIELLARWQAEIGGDAGLLLVDGPLRIATPGAVGLVKSFTRQYLTGEASSALFRMKHGERSAAFRVVDGWRSEVPVDAWYQRHWDATGRDPRHALVRIELSSDWSGKPAVDDVAGWIMRERVPAAKADARWATLLYPVHYLEEILKRRIDAETRGWSSQV
jgi:hypothetical protein